MSRSARSKLALQGVGILILALLAVGTITCLCACSRGAAKQTDSDRLCAQVVSKLTANDFAALDALAGRLRDPDIRLLGGNSQLYEFYGSLVEYSVAGSPSCGADLTFNQKRGLLEKWGAAAPQSVAAHIALSDLWMHAGWTARGDAYAGDATDDQWRTLAADMVMAKSALMNVDIRADPHGYYVLMEIARADPDARQTLDRLYAAAVEAYPTYYHYYSLRATQLLQRWFGRPGEFQDYAASLLRSPGGDAGLVAYSYVAHDVMRLFARPTLLQETGLSWPDIKAAYATREKLYGLRGRDWNALCFLAVAALDRDTARTALAKIGDNWEPGVWGEQKYFDADVAWINRRKPAT